MAKPPPAKKRKTDTSADTSPIELRYDVKEELKLGSTAITVRVGKDEQEHNFLVHEDLIRSRSPFFQAALSHDWVEASERIVRLPEDLPEFFGIYHQWLYSGKIFSKREGDQIQDGDREWRRLARAYALGEKLSDADFKDTLIDAMVQKLGTSYRVPSGWYKSAYAETPATSPLRRLCVDIAIWEWPSTTFDKLRQEVVPSDFLLDLPITFGKLLRTGEYKDLPPYKTDTCIYHEHTKLDTPCYKSKQRP